MMVSTDGLSKTRRLGHHMSESTSTSAPPKPEYQFDDRTDLNTNISSAEAMVLLARSFALLKDVKKLFCLKFFLAFIALFPALLVPWFGKIVVDQVLLQRPYGETDIRFPPFIEPFITMTSGMPPMQIMLAIVLTYSVLLLLFGIRGAETRAEEITQGQDSATQSEKALSNGGSSAGGIWGLIEMMIDIRLTQRIANTLRTRLFQKMTRFSMTTLADQRIGDSVYRVMYDAPQVPRICFYLTILPVILLINASITLGLIEYSYGEVAPELVLLAWALLPLGLIVTFPMSRIIRNVNQQSRASGAATTNIIEESMANITAVQSLGAMVNQRDKFAEGSIESFRRYRLTFAFAMVLYILGWAITIFAGLYVVRLVSDDIISGVMSPGDFWTLFGLYLDLGAVALGIGMIWIQLQINVAAVRRVFFFIDLEAEDARDSKPALSPLQKTIAFEHVTFDYPDGRSALRNINLTLQKGELIAIVGPTGAGKTSLASLIPSFIVPTAGSVTFDGNDISEATVDSVRDQVSYVFQEHLLFSESIRNNLLIARPDATEEEIRVACVTASAMKFIEDLPNGLDTVLGRTGDTLSVGQQQRLCIAQGLIRDTPILILDEPTAALDPQTENALIKALLVAAENKLVIVIAHRLSTIRQANMIVFLEDGEILDSGNHETMMKNPVSPYRKFVELQSGKLTR